mmetsp:Transcript_110990/g.277878  ORF Transcript_110990/g.277878 Transcript_110990/m.277878 type:complete len:240 (-) Transcript_110990:1289-2008(-)
MRNARSTACASVAGFQAGSTRMTRSALVRLRPTPPTFVVSNMHWKRSRSRWNLATFSALAAGSVCPSIRRQRRLLGFRQQIWMRSNIFTLWQKTKVRWPRDASAGSISARHRSFELWPPSACRERGSLRSIISTARPPRASSCTAPAPPPTARLSSAPSDASSAWVSSEPGSPEAGSSSLAVMASCKSSAQAPGLPVGSSSAGWLHSLFKRPMALKTSMPSFCLLQASRMTSLFSRTRW